MQANRMLRDVEFFRSRISKLEGAAGLGEYLVKVVEKKRVADFFTDSGHNLDDDNNVIKSLQLAENAAEKT